MERYPRKAEGERSVMRQRVLFRNPEAARLRGKSVALAAACTCLAAVPALTILHQHELPGFVGIGVQVVLLVLAIRFFTIARRLEAASR